METEVKQQTTCTYNVTLRRVYEMIVAMESNKYYIFLCVCVCVSHARSSGWGQAYACVSLCVCVDGGWVWVKERGRVLALVYVILGTATWRRHIFCVLSGSKKFIDIIS